MTENNKSPLKIDTIELLIIHLSKYVGAYRKSYKLCSIVDITIKVIGGLVGCSAILALIPAVPIVVSISGAIPAGLAIISKMAQFEEKKALYKMQHRTLKELLSYVQKSSAQISTDDTESVKNLIKEAFSIMLENEKD